MNLETLSLEGLSLELPPGALGTPRRLQIKGTEGLRGQLVSDPSGLRISELVGQRLVLRALDWSFGGVRLASDQLAELDVLAGSIEHGAEELVIELTASTLRAARLSLSVGDLRLAARLEAADVELQIGRGLGSLKFGSATLRELEVHLPGLRVFVPELHASAVTADWGGPQFRLELGTCDAAALTLDKPGWRTHASGVYLAALRAHGPSFNLGRARVEDLALTAELSDATPRATDDERGARRAAPSQAPRAAEPPLFDLELLNGVAGRLHADVDVDLAVPVIGRRRATHRMRLTLRDGSLDFMQVEDGLATLEDSLLDFSVRDGALVLERGLPLLKTRGRGKPILIWDLGAEDLARAEQNHLRLALVPRFRLAGKGERQEPEAGAADEEGSGFRLRELSLLGLEAALNTARSTHTTSGAVRQLSVLDLTVAGELHYSPERPSRAGELQVALEGFCTSLEGFPVGSRALKSRLEISALRDLALAFEGLRLRHVEGRLHGLTVTELELG